MSLSTRLVDAWTQLFALCKLQSEESVLILIGDITDPEHHAAARFALARLGNPMMSVELGASVAVKVGGDSTAHYGPTALSGNRLAIEAMKRTDLIVDLMGMYRGSEQEEILESGARIILVKEPPEIFMRLLPTETDRLRVKRAETRMRAARRLDVTSAAGTRFSARFGEYPPLVQYGFADEPGRWDHAPSAFIARWPDEASSNGIVVLDEGDTILPFKDYVRTPIRLTIENGFVTGIEGGLDARYLRDYIASFNDPDGYAVSHLGWGLLDRAHWTMLGMYDKRQTNGMDARSYAGNFMFSTGPNAEAGGTRHTPCHLDIPMSGCSVQIDGVPVVIDGQVIETAPDTVRA
ncbi:2,5-dihydroxypyridine 5,6-dioxygenase [Caballeronia sp. LZ043]|uniref:2,5-dihydroxypyridine 5,6-dioxygenase n=1 Tax=Caballeronia sp. LZ043 TaxID=3038569 RepID=UPI00285D471D|nr:2,5-dihydroxypyridine 5,6-dioxygenase [Caballeronia sp. LZ043]MDR5821558.1 2,5-dihydroxypyridine 5,6-dioxygenase [Caballeronia sp. LZ043]